MVENTSGRAQKSGAAIACLYFIVGGGWKSRAIVYIAFYRPISTHEKRAPWHSNRIIGEIALSETGRRAHETTKNRERRKRGRRNAKLSKAHLTRPAKTSKVDELIEPP
ncbi:MAG: hypothetical protein JO084_01710 [Bradyrhizobiaceae bacterium]|nr:hypothetical protein [Bradyrhizobiaceae bacterium]